ncbi:MAG: hypothetical protein AAFR68_23730 [Pseudomonadota bacterium]
MNRQGSLSKCDDLAIAPNLRVTTISSKLAQTRCLVARLGSTLRNNLSNASDHELTELNSSTPVFFTAKPKEVLIFNA